MGHTRVAASAQAEAAGFLGRGIVQSGDWWNFELEDCWDFWLGDW